MIVWDVLHQKYILYTLAYIQMVPIQAQLLYYSWCTYQVHLMTKLHKANSKMHSMQIIEDWLVSWRDINSFFIGGLLNVGFLFEWPECLLFEPPEIFLELPQEPVLMFDEATKWLKNFVSEVVLLFELLHDGLNDLDS